MKPPKIEFPCRYEIRILGDSRKDFQKICQQIIKQHDPEYDGNIRVKKSREGRFCSIMVNIFAIGEEQLRKIHKDLKLTGMVKMVI